MKEYLSIPAEVENRVVLRHQFLHSGVYHGHRVDSGVYPRTHIVTSSYYHGHRVDSGVYDRIRVDTSSYYHGHSVDSGVYDRHRVTVESTVGTYYHGHRVDSGVYDRHRADIQGIGLGSGLFNGTLRLIGVGTRVIPFGESTRDTGLAVGKVAFLDAVCLVFLRRVVYLVQVLVRT